MFENKLMKNRLVILIYVELRPILQENAARKREKLAGSMGLTGKNEAW